MNMNAVAIILLFAFLAGLAALEAFARRRAQIKLRKAQTKNAMADTERKLDENKKMYDDAESRMGDWTILNVPNKPTFIAGDDIKLGEVVTVSPDGKLKRVAIGPISHAGTDDSGHDSGGPDPIGHADTEDE